MTAVALALTAAALAGLPVAIRAFRPRGWVMVVAGSILTGLGFAGMAMLLLSLAGLAWTLGSTIAGTAVVAVIAALFIPPEIPSENSAETGTSTRSERALAIALDVGAAFLIGGQLLYVTAAPPWEWDFTAIWGLKGAMFTSAGGIDFGALSDPELAFAHPDYPPLLPLIYAWVALWGGGWSDRHLALIVSVVAIAALLVVRSHLKRRLGRPLLVSMGTLALTRALFDTPPALADGLLLCFLTVAVLAIFDNDGENQNVVPWLWLGFAALTKNEGIAAVVSVTLALLLVRRRAFSSALAGRALIAATIAMCWIIPRAIFDLESDLGAGSPFSRVPENVGDLLSALAAVPPAHALQWGTVLAAIILARRLAGRDLGILCFAAAQLAFYLGGYLVTPHEVAWHVATSWPRLTMHLLPLMIVVATSALALTFGWVAVPGSRQKVTRTE
ncbi:MAG: hypothetical protein KY459_13660 [Acidobacteria bacterium]|nr:hypothetical protein [Acidobacteriota bacterium]